MELQMAFGTVSSPHIFDVGSDVPKEITDKKVGVSREFAPKCLDDLIPVGQKDVVKRYCKEYRDLCARTGVRLAEESDGPNKCFGVMREGEVLGIHYDLDKWMWSVPRAKTLRLTEEISEALEKKEATVELLERIKGKIIHYEPVIPTGKWQRSWILAQTSEELPKSRIVKLSRVTCWQLEWWRTALLICMEGSKIPDPRGWAKMEGVHIHSDAAGGGTSTSGFGSVTMGDPDWGPVGWSHGKWPGWLNRREGSRTLGVKFDLKLTTLEGFAALVALASSHKEVRGKTCYLHVDNSGFVYGAKKGSSKCLFAASVIKACHDVAQGLGTKLVVMKEARCSSLGAEAADAFSKSDMERAKAQFGKRMQGWRRKTPETLERWIQDPVPDPELGFRVLSELAGSEENFPWGQPRLDREDLVAGAQELNISKRKRKWKEGKKEEKKSGNRRKRRRRR